MLQLPILALFLRAIPEGILLILASYVIANKEIDKKKIILSGILLGISVYGIRLLPIHFGVHTIIYLMLYIFIVVKANGIDIYKAIGTSIVCIIVVFILDWLSMVFYIKILQISYSTIFENPLTYALCGVPSLLLGLLVILFFSYVKRYSNRKVH